MIVQHSSYRCSRLGQQRSLFLFGRRVVSSYRLPKQWRQVLHHQRLLLFPSGNQKYDCHLQQQQGRRQVSSGTEASSSPKTSHQSTTVTTAVKLHSLLPHGCLSYPQTWALQQVLLHRRLQARRNQQQLGPPNDAFNFDSDCVLMMEHSPVYTLGRGADENHLTFAQQHEQSSSGTELLHISSEISQKLSRTVRGPGTARLSLDKNTEARLHELLAVASSRDVTGNNGEDDGDVRSMLGVVDRLTKSVSPVMAPNGVPVYRVDRGGEVTYHGPSQLVVYPMLDLKHGNLKDDLHWYLRKIEDVVMLTLKHYGIDTASRDETHTGVWVDEGHSHEGPVGTTIASAGKNKIAAVGVSSTRWITTHGFALNVDPDLSAFDTSLILPCGIEDRGVTSMGQVLRQQRRHHSPKIPTVSEVAVVVTRMMEEVFGVKVR